MNADCKGLSAEELNKMGMVFMESQQQEEEALKYFNKAIELNPELLDSYYNKAGVFATNGKYDDALSCYESIIDKDNEQGAAYYLMGSIQFFAKEDVKKAVELYNKAIHYGVRHADVYHNMGQCLLSAGKKEEALKWFERGEKINESSTIILLHKAEVLMQLNRYEESYGVYEKVLTVEADNEEAFHFKAILLAVMDKPEEAIKLIDEAEELIGGRVIFQYDRALMFENQKKFKEALEAVEKGLQIDSVNSMLLVKKGSLLTVLENFEGAKNVFDTVSDLEPENAEGAFHKASVHFLQDEYEEASKVLAGIIEKCRDEDPYKINAYYYRALALKLAGKGQEAMQAFDEALTTYSVLAMTHTYDIRLMLLKANTLREMQRNMEADELYEYVLDLDNQIAENHLMRAKNYIYMGKLSEAKKQIEEALAIDPAYQSLIDADKEFKSVM